MLIPPDLSGGMYPGTASPSDRGHKRPPHTSRYGLRPPPPGGAAWWPLEPERLRDDAALDLGGAAVDCRGQGLADEALHVVLGGVAVAAHHLHALEGDAL